MYDVCGIIHFFDNHEELETLLDVISGTEATIEEPDSTEYGDFQTNAILTNKAASHLASGNISPEIVVEPTCGKGNFDIGEFITVVMIKTFHQMNGHLFFLVKNSVIKNLVFDQSRNQYQIASLEKHAIDSKTVQGSWSQKEEADIM
jgi:arginyl-tRNA synthetase